MYVQIYIYMYVYVSLYITQIYIYICFPNIPDIPDIPACHFSTLGFLGTGAVVAGSGGSCGGSSGGSSRGPGSDIGLWTGATKKGIYHDLADEFLHRYFYIDMKYGNHLRNILMCFRHVAELLGSFFSGAAQEKRPCDFNWNMFL